MKCVGSSRNRVIKGILNFSADIMYVCGRKRDARDFPLARIELALSSTSARRLHSSWFLASARITASVKIRGFGLLVSQFESRITTHRKSTFQRYLWVTDLTVFSLTNFCLIILKMYTRWRCMCRQCLQEELIRLIANEWTERGRIFERDFHRNVDWSTGAVLQFVTSIII